MSLHDAYARRTPFELAFPEVEAVDDLIAAVVEEAKGRGADPTDPRAFMTMGSVGRFIRGLQDPDAPVEAIHQYAALVYHAVHFRDAGSPTYVLAASAARYLVEGAPDGTPAAPAPAGYLQLPQHLFWASPEGDGPPESIDGLFWSLSDDGLLRALLVTGVRPDRSGFGTVPIPEAPFAEAGSWLDAVVRPGGGDFRSTLPGAELDGLYALEAAGEVLKLLARLFAYTSRVPKAIVEGVIPDEVTARDAPPASELPFKRIELHPRESKKARRERAAEIYDLLAEEYPDAHCELDFANAFQLAVSTILSAQTTDERVNMVTPELFRRFADADALANADQGEVEEVIRTTGFFRNKAKNIIGFARGLMAEHDGEVPRSMDDLSALPGVGRKTANVILGNAFGIDEGVVVDTHVKRLTNLMRLTRRDTPEKIERDLMELFPPERWTMLAHLLIWHGRRVCDARKPACERCVVSHLCPSSRV